MRMIPSPQHLFREWNKKHYLNEFSLTCEGHRRYHGEKNDEAMFIHCYVSSKLSIVICTGRKAVSVGRNSDQTSSSVTMQLERKKTETLEIEPFFRMHWLHGVISLVVIDCRVHTHTFVKFISRTCLRKLCTKPRINRNLCALVTRKLWYLRKKHVSLTTRLDRERQKVVRLNEPENDRTLWDASYLVCTQAILAKSSKLLAYVHLPCSLHVFPPNLHQGKSHDSTLYSMHWAAVKASFKERQLC